MATINMQRELNLNKDQIQQLAEKVGEKLACEYGVQFSWSGHDANISGPGINGKCQVCDGSIGLQLTLGFLLTPFKDKVEREISSYLERLQD